MAGILVYALHYEGAFNKNSLGAVTEASKVGEEGSRTRVLAVNPPPQKQAGTIIEDEDTNETVEKLLAWLDERKLI